MFKAPLQLLVKDDIKQLTPLCSDDLQLDMIYNDLLGISDSPVRKMWLTHYTTNTDYLKDTQKLLKQGEFPTIILTSHIEELLKQMKKNPSFREKYEYITTDYFEKFNKNETILQCISVYTLTSPILALMTPIIMLFIPFFVLRFMGKSVTFTNYIAELKRIFAMMPLGKIFQLGEASWDQRGFILFTLILYFVQMYQNTLTCYKFYKNSKSMVSDIHDFGHYCNKTATSMEEFKESHQSFTTYQPFIASLEQHIPVLYKMGKNFLGIRNKTFKDMGYKMKVYYDLYCDVTYTELFQYTFEYHEYIDNLKSLSEIDALNICKFSKHKSTKHKSTKHKSTFTNAYYALLRDDTPVKNSYSLQKNGILSGPNASGKTTLLKSTMINMIMSQQIGKGFYDKATITPYDYFHCYINIPDTCERDSLFQAEARRCKEILTIIEQNPGKKHLCVFDELFSGTNPYEAVASATGYLTYLNKDKNVKYLLTTHYLDLCSKFIPSKEVINYTLDSPYHLQKGISTIKGGIKVLEQLEFPQEIITTAKHIVTLN